MKVNYGLMVHAMYLELLVVLMKDQSIENLMLWVKKQLSLADEEFVWQSLKGDAGFRQYFRVQGDSSKIAVYAPPATEDSNAFVNIGRYLASYSVRCPKVFFTDLNEGYLILEDLGHSTLFDFRNSPNLGDLYELALDQLFHIQSAPISDVFPVYSHEKLVAEMCLTADWFIPKLLGVSLCDEDLEMLQSLFLTIATEVALQPSVIVHRDFHSQNLMISDSGRLGVVDFQDAVMGPVTYDLVSLLRDCYFKWPEQHVRAVALNYKNRLVCAGVIDDVHDHTFMRWFDWMGMQRHLKVLGIFTRLSLRDGKDKYLSDLPLVMEYVIGVARQYDEFSCLVELFNRELLPQVKRQNWSSCTYDKWERH